MSNQLISSIEVKYSYLHRTIFAVIALGAGVTMPQVFHYFGLGSTFLPMFIPVLLFAAIESPLFILPVAVAVPFLSYLLTGMPLLSNAGVIAGELIVLSLTLSTLRTKVSLPVAIVTSIIINRLFAFGVAFISGQTLLTYTGVVASYPGVIVMIGLGLLVAKFYNHQTE